MINISRMERKRYLDRGGGAFRLILSLLLTAAMAAGFFGQNSRNVYAAARTVTIKQGAIEWYAPGDQGGTTVKWVTHIDGEPVDLDEVPGVSRSYAYCVQPSKKTPADGTYNIVLVEDDDKGTIAKMRKLIYYLPGAYGYTKVTKKRWFSNNNTGASAYSLGHIALSYLYAKDDAWNGEVGNAIKNKVFSILDDLGNLSNPPDDFEVFWIRIEGHQDVFGAFNKSEYGKAAVKKSSSLENVSEGNSEYSLSGAEYTLYHDEKCSEPAKTKDGKAAVIVTKADGSSDSIEVETGNYYIKETKAPKGYAKDKGVYSIEAIKDKTTTFNALEQPITDKVGVLLNKSDRNKGGGKAQGDASLAGAVFRFDYYDAQIGSATAASSSGNPKAVWHFITGSDGKISGSNPKFAEGFENSKLYRDAEGNIVFPLGTYVISEVKAPLGYKLSSEKKVVNITEDGSDSAYVKTYNEKTVFDEDVVKGGVKLLKIDNDLDEANAQGDAKLSAAEFTVYNKSRESVVVNGKEIAAGAAALTIKCDEKGVAASTANALPYGSYAIRESKAPEGYLINSNWEKSFSIREDGKVIDLAGESVRESVMRSGIQIVKRDKELSKSEAQGAADLDGIEMTIRNVSDHDIVVRADFGSAEDKVDWKKPAPKKDLFDAEKIRIVKPGEDAGKIVTHWNEDKKAYTAETLSDDLPYGSYTIRETKTGSSYQRTDKTEHRFEIREDGTVYAYDDKDMGEILSFDNYVYRSDIQGTKIGDGDSRRLSYIPFKIISVSNGETHVVVSDNNGFFSTADRRTRDEIEEEEGTDTSRNKNPFDDLLGAEGIKKAELQQRASQMRMGVWFGTGEHGSMAEMDASAGALPYDSYIIEEMPCDGNEGYTMQKFFFTVDEKSRNGLVDLETITNDIPEIGTKASVDGNNRGVSPAKQTELTDVIEYSGLKPMTKYIAKGRLVDKSSGEIVRDAAGVEITAEKEFTTVLSKGTTKVVFTFDGSNMNGAEAVCFEKVYDMQGHLIATHEDLNDENQTVIWSEDKHVPVLQETPVTPEKPDEPDSPADPEKPDKPDSPDKPKKPHSPDTGDGMSMKLLYCLAAIAVSLEALLLTVKRRNDRLN